MRAVMLLAAVAACRATIASQSPPGGLASSNTPMFILFSHDDGLASYSADFMLEVTEGNTAAQGCPVTATMFVSDTGTDCSVVMDLYNKGYEMADHTKNHVSLYGEDKSKVGSEIMGGKNALVACGVPESDVVGFRAPLLQTDPGVREVLAENGFLYESSIIEEGTGNSVSGGMDSRVWPFDMGEGVPLNCAWFSGTIECSTSESYPGLFQVPVWQLTETGTAYSMDYGMDSGEDVYKILKDNFKAAYEGNRAPFPIFVHTPWLSESEHLKDLKRFVDYTRELPDVYFVTFRQLLAWMQNPVGADQLTPEALGCGLPGGAPGSDSTTPTAEYSKAGEAGSSTPPPVADTKPKPVAAADPEPAAAAYPSSTQSSGNTVENAFAALGFTVRRLRRMLSQ